MKAKSLESLHVSLKGKTFVIDMRPILPMIYFRVFWQGEFEWY